LLGHASPDTVMIYAKLYPSRLVEEYRKTVRGLYNAHYGDDGLKNPTAEEWAAFAASCNLRDMGTHLCALPTGEYCPRGLVCLGCTHAQPKKSAVPIFRRMLASHQRSLNAAHEHNEPAGQIASRELEIVRIKGALQRAEELSDDVTAAMEGGPIKTRDYRRGSQHRWYQSYNLTARHDWFICVEWRCVGVLGMRMSDRPEFPKGTLDMLILKIVALGPIHGYAISQRIQQISNEVFQLTQGSLYPALHRLEDRGWLQADWRASDTGREAKYYKLSKRGQRQLEAEVANWDQLTHAVALILATSK
jgi:transcriptional regulator